MKDRYPRAMEACNPSGLQMIVCEVAGDAQALQPPPEMHLASTQKGRAAGRKRARVKSVGELSAADDKLTHVDARALKQRVDGPQPFRTGLWEVSECESLEEAMKQHGNDWERVALLVATRTAAQVEKFASRYLASSKAVRSVAEGNRHAEPSQPSPKSTAASNRSEARRPSIPPRGPIARRKSLEWHEGPDKPPPSRSEVAISPAQDPRRRAIRPTPGASAFHAIAAQQVLVSSLPGEPPTGFGLPGSAIISPVDPRSFVPTSASSTLPAAPSRQLFTPSTVNPVPFSHVPPGPHSEPRGFTLNENIVESDIQVLLATSPQCRTNWSQFIARLCVLSDADELTEILRRYAVIAQDKIPEGCATDALQTCLLLQQLTGVARRQFQAAVRSVYFGHGNPGAGLRFYTVYAKHAQITSAEAEILVYFCVEVAQISEQMEAEQAGAGMATPLPSASASADQYNHYRQQQQQLLAAQVTASTERASEPRSAVPAGVPTAGAAAETANVSGPPEPESAAGTAAPGVIIGGAAPIAVQAEVPHLLQQGTPKLVTCMLAVFTDPATNRNKWKFVRLQSNSMTGVAPVAPLEYLWCRGENRDKYHVIDQSRLFAIPEKHNVFIQPQISPTAIKIRAIIDCVINLCQIDITKEWCQLDNVWNNMPPPHWWKVHVNAGHHQLSELLKTYVMNRYG